MKEQKEAAIRSPQVAENSSPARFIRVRILHGQPVIWEAKLLSCHEGG